MVDNFPGRHRRLFGIGLLAVVVIPVCAGGAWLHFRSLPSSRAIAPDRAQQVAPRKVPLAIPTYEPIQYNGADSATAAQKAKFAEIRDYALADMQRRHVSARKINQFLWQMHYFVPVKYAPVDCAAIANDEAYLKRLKAFNGISGTHDAPASLMAPLPRYMQDFVAMDHAMRDTNEAFKKDILITNPKAQAAGIAEATPTNHEISVAGIVRQDELQMYAAQLWDFIAAYRLYIKSEKSCANSLALYHITEQQCQAQTLSTRWSEVAHNNIDPSTGACSGDGNYFTAYAIGWQKKSMEGYFIGNEPPMFPRGSY